MLIVVDIELTHTLEVLATLHQSIFPNLDLRLSVLIRVDIPETCRYHAELIVDDLLVVLGKVKELGFLFILLSLLGLSQ